MPGAAIGGVRLLLRLEGVAMGTVALVAYAQHGLGWSAFAWLFLLPDAAFLGYLAGARIGATAYDATHSTLGPLALLMAGMLGGLPTATALALVWFAHVGFDRALGYGLKYASGFTATHLGRIGRRDPW